MGWQTVMLSNTYSMYTAIMTFLELPCGWKRNGHLSNSATEYDGSTLINGVNLQLHTWYQRWPINAKHSTNSSILMKVLFASPIFWKCIAVYSALLLCMIHKNGRKTENVLSN